MQLHELSHMVGAGTSLLMEEGNHQHFLPGKDSSRTVGTSGGSDSAVEGNRAHGWPRFRLCLCGHSMVFLPLSQVAPLAPLEIPLLHFPRDLDMKQTKSIYTCGRSRPWDAPPGQSEEAIREVWNLSPRSGRMGRGEKWAALVGCGREGHQWGAHCL